MSIITAKKKFLTEEIANSLKNLKADTPAAFGIMTSQHMIEHLTWIIKSSAKDHGEPEGQPSKGQLGFKKFIEGGAIFKHRPKDQSKEDLPPLKYGSLEEAMAQIPLAISRFYHFYEGKSDKKGYHPMMGELTFEEIELFHYMHVRYHFWQFGLLGEYP